MKQPTRRFAYVAIALISFVTNTYGMGIIEAFYKFPVEIAFQLPSSQKQLSLPAIFLTNLLWLQVGTTHLCN